MMTAVMMKADTKPARRGSNVGESWAIVAGTETQETRQQTILVYSLSIQADNTAFRTAFTFTQHGANTASGVLV